MKLPRFTLRDLFWLVLVCALALGWWMDRIGAYFEKRYAQSLMWAAERNGYTFEAAGNGMKMVPLHKP